jgi:hypothetical protein
MAPLIEAFSATGRESCSKCNAHIPAGLCAYRVAEQRIYGPCCASNQLTTHRVQEAAAALLQRTNEKGRVPREVP